MSELRVEKDELEPERERAREKQTSEAHSGRPASLYQCQSNQWFINRRVNEREGRARAREANRGTVVTPRERPAVAQRIDEERQEASEREGPSGASAVCLERERGMEREKERE